MRFLLFFFFTSNVFISFDQLTVASESYPIHDAVEWQGVGSLFLAKDPDARQKDHNVILLNTLGEVQWKEKFYPKSETPSLILGHKSSYIYFLDNFIPENHKIFYHQINMSGSVKSTSLELLSHAKKMGYSSSTDLTLIDVINTNGALVFQFIAENKSEKVYENIFIFLTHHNHRTYAVKTIPSKLEGLKDNSEAMLKYAGSDNEKIYFSRIIDRASKSTLEFIPFSAKGEEGLTQVFTLDKKQQLSMEILPLHFSGDYYISSSMADYSAQGYGYYLNNQFYALTFDVTNNQFLVSQFDSKGNPKALIQEAVTKDKKDKYKVAIRLMEVRDALLTEVNSNSDSFYVSVKMKPEIIKFPAGISNIQFMKNPSIIHFGKSSTIFVHPLEVGFLSTSSVGIGKSVSLDFE